MDTEQSDEAFYGSCDPDAEQEQKHRFFSERLQCVKYQRTDPVYRKPWAIQYTAVSQKSLCDPVKDFLIHPAH